MKYLMIASMEKKSTKKQKMANVECDYQKKLEVSNGYARML